MAFCPKCKDEYREGIEFCAECGEKLVETLPKDDSKHPSIEFVLLAEAQGEIQTRLLKAALEQDGIPTILVGDNLDTFQIYPSYESRILVPRRLLERAQTVMEVVLSPASDVELDEEAMEEGVQKIYCESCGEEVPSDAKECPHCGARFDE